MAEIETLTEEERYEMRDSATSYDTNTKALRIIDAQAVRITQLIAEVTEHALTGAPR